MVVPGKRRYEPFQDDEDYFLQEEHSLPYQRRSRTDTKTGANNESNDEFVYIVSLIENKSKEVGIAAYNLKSFEVELRQFVDNNTYWTTLSTLCVLNPVEILISSTSTGKSMHNALLLNPIIANVPMTTLDRKYFNDTQGMLYCEKLTVEKDNLQDLIGRQVPRYLALAACSALIKYVENVQCCTFARGTLRLKFKDNEDTLLMDYETLQSLEIVSCNAKVCGIPNPQHSTVLRNLNFCKTRIGTRYLRKSLLEPPCDYATITTRQEALKELTQNESLFFQIQTSLVQFPDLEGILSQIIQVQKRDDVDRRKRPGLLESEIQTVDIKLIRNFLLLTKALGQVHAILDAVCRGRSPLIASISTSLRNPSLSNMFNLVTQVIDSESPSNRTGDKIRLEGAYAVRSGRNELLDLSRKILSETIDQIHHYFQSLQNIPGFERASLAYSQSRGYHIKLISSQLPDIEEELLRLAQNANIFRFTTRTLNGLNIRCRETLNDIIRITNQELQMLLNEIWNAENMVSLHCLCDAIGILDCLASFASYVSKSERLVLPKISTKGPIAIKNGRHPLLEKQIKNYVPHDTFLSAASSFYLISGSNMSGKTTFMKAVASICVLAHAGCFVPADFASVCLINRIIVRTTTNDSAEENCSSFSKEMRETASVLCCLEEMEAKYQLREARQNKPIILVVFDELARATSPMEGFSIAFAVAEQLVASPVAYCLFSTHFQEKSLFEDLYACAKSFYLTSSFTKDDSDNSGSQNAHVLTRGFIKEKNYGIATAKEAGFPSNVISLAEQLVDNFTQQISRCLTKDSSAQEEQCKKEFSLLQKLIVLKNAGLEKERYKSIWEENMGESMEQDLANVIDQGDTEALYRLLAPVQQSQSKTTSNGKETKKNYSEVKENKETFQERFDELFLTEKEQLQLQPLLQQFPFLDSEDILSIYEACNEDKDLARTVLESLVNSEAIKNNNVPGDNLELDTEGYSKALQEWSQNFPSLQSVSENQMEKPSVDLGKVVSDSRSLVFKLRLRKLATLFPNVEETNIAHCLNANDWKYKETFSELVKRSIKDDSSPKPVHTTKQLTERSNKKSTMDISKEIRLDKGTTKNIWVSTGTTVGDLYEKSRLQAKELASLRNQMFMQAARAASNGNKRAASDYARRGHEYNQIMKQLHEEAADAIFTERNSNADFVIDLHGLHVKEAIVILERKFQELESRRSNESFQDVIIVTGSGHHTKGKKTPARLYPAVEHFLLSRHYSFEVLKDTNKYAGAFLVHLR
ncbi:MutS protein homolog 4 [Galdieria sulphuraria]|nr:MutS protein homolog 4 [Galdieria sulphuraria]